MEHLWQLYNAEGYLAVQAAQSPDALDQFLLALLAYAEQDLPTALDHCRTAALLDPSSLVFQETVAGLENLSSAGARNVYAISDAFEAFIRSAGNLHLYNNLHSLLRQRYDQHEAARLLDIGAGDGLALLPSLNDHIAEVTIVEPSQGMLATAVNGLKSLRIPNDPHACTLGEFLKESSNSTWDLAQSTFALHNIRPEERKSQLAWLRKVSSRLLVAEFDVPAFSGLGAPDHVRYVKNRYEHGLAEYAESPLVKQGFLLPVMLGYFNRVSARTTYEQPIDAWIEELKEAGFSKVEKQLIYDYWWAPAYLIDAS